MKSINSLLANILILISSFLIFSCNKKTECTSCLRDKSSTIDLKFINKIQNLTFKNSPVYKSEDDPLEASLIDLQSKEYSKLNEVINYVTGNSEVTSKNILYTDKLLSKFDSIDENSIFAISRISLRNNILMHTFYIKKGNVYVMDSILSTVTYLLSANSIERILKEVVFPGQKDFSYVIFSNIDVPVKKSKTKIDLLDRKVKDFLQKRTKQSDGNSSNYFDDDLKRCKTALCGIDKLASICEVISPPICEAYNPFPVPVPTSSPCRSNYLQNLVTELGEMPDSLETTFDSTLHFGIRDSILNHSTFGIKYIVYYYDLSLIYNSEDNADPSLILNTARLLFLMNDYFNALLNHSSNSEVIFINSDMKVKILDLISEYKSVYNDEYTEEVFQDIITDLNSVENLTISEVISYFL